MSGAESSVLTLRRNNYRNRILAIIRSNDNVSRHDIKQITKYSMTTTLNTVSEMLSKGYIVESGTGESSGGRKPIYLKINPSGAHFLGVDFNSKFVYSAIINLNGDIVYKDSISIPNELNNTASIILLIRNAISNMISHVLDGGPIFGIGLGVPGYIDKRSGAVGDYAFIRDFSNVRLEELIKNEFPYDIFIENNINAMALAYKWIEYDGACDNFALISIRSGLRMAAIVKNNLVKGAAGAAGEIDHIQIPGAGRPCSCGKKGCLVTEISNTAILSKVVEGILSKRFKAVSDIIGGDLSALGMSAITKAYLSGDPEVRELARETAGYLGHVLSIIIAIHNPQKLVIRTDFQSDGGDFLNILCDLIKQSGNPHHLENLEIEYAKFGEHIGAIGAACLVMQNTIYCNETIRRKTAVIAV